MSKNKDLADAHVLMLTKSLDAMQMDLKDNTNAKYCFYLV